MASPLEPDKFNINAPEPIVLEDTLQNGPDVQSCIEGNIELLTAIQEGYREDKLFRSVIGHLAQFTMFQSHDGLLFTKNQAGAECLCIPQVRFHE